MTSRACHLRTCGLSVPWGGNLYCTSTGTDIRHTPYVESGDPSEVLPSLVGTTMASLCGFMSNYTWSNTYVGGIRTVVYVPRVQGYKIPLGLIGFSFLVLKPCRTPSCTSPR